MRPRQERGDPPPLAVPARPAHRCLPANSQSLERRLAPTLLRALCELCVKTTPAPQRLLMTTIANSSTPAGLGFSMPAEWERHEATWLGWPHNQTDWPGKLDTIRWVYGEIVRKISPGELVRMLVNNKAEEGLARRFLSRSGADVDRVGFIVHPTNRGWLRDSGPIFLRRGPHRTQVRGQRSEAGGQRSGLGGLRSETAIVHFHFNGWAKYKDWQKDRRVPEIAARILRKRLFNAQINGKDFVIEGG